MARNRRRPAALDGCFAAPRACHRWAANWLLALLCSVGALERGGRGLPLPRGWDRRRSCNECPREVRVRVERPRHVESGRRDGPAERALSSWPRSNDWGPPPLAIPWSCRALHRHPASARAYGERARPRRLRLLPPRHRRLALEPPRRHHQRRDPERPRPDPRGSGFFRDYPGARAPPDPEYDAVAQGRLR